MPGSFLSCGQEVGLYHSTRGNPVKRPLIGGRGRVLIMLAVVGGMIEISVQEHGSNETSWQS
jgi:hypothetical protein